MKKERKEYDVKWMMKNSKGREDAMLTFAFISFTVVSLCVLLSMFKGFVFKNFSFELTTPDSTLLLGYLAATFGAYVTRRYHDKGEPAVVVVQKEEVKTEGEKND